jgi:hypothetical protein
MVQRRQYSVKYFIRLLVGLLLTYIVGQQFQLSNAAPSRKYRLQKTTTTTTTTTISNGLNKTESYFSRG